MLETRNFLIPDATFAIEMLALLVVLVVMTRYVLPRIRASMQARQQTISTALAAAREARAQEAAAQAEAENVRAAARREASEIAVEARALRDHLIAEGRRAGIEEYRWLSGRADRELQRRTQAADTRLQQQARAAAISAARAYVGDDVDRAQIEHLVDHHFAAQTVKGRAASRSGIHHRALSTLPREPAGRVRSCDAGS